MQRLTSLVAYDKARTFATWFSDSFPKCLSQSNGELALDAEKFKTLETEARSYLSKAGAPSAVTVTSKDLLSLLENPNSVKSWDGRPLEKWLERPGQRPGTVSALPVLYQLDRQLSLQSVHSEIAGMGRESPHLAITDA